MPRSARGGHAERLLERTRTRTVSCSRSTRTRSSCRRPKRAADSRVTASLRSLVRRTNFAGSARALSTSRLAATARTSCSPISGVSSMQLDDPARGFTFKVRRAARHAHESEPRAFGRAVARTRVGRTDGCGAERERRRAARRFLAGSLMHGALTPCETLALADAVRAALTRTRRSRRERVERATRLPGAADRGQRRIRRTRRVPAPTSACLRPGGRLGAPLVPFGRGPPREEGLPAGSRARGPLRSSRTKWSALQPPRGARIHGPDRRNCDLR